MTTVAFSALVPDVAIHVQGCPPPVIINALRFAAIDFCSRTGIWRSLLAAQNVVAGSYNYTLNPPTGTLVHKVLWVKHNDVVLPALTQEILLDRFPLQPDIINTSLPQFYAMPDHRAIQLVPVPVDALTAGLKVFASLRPTASATGVDDIVTDAYTETLVHGALQRLMAIPEKSWSVPKAVEYHGHEFSVGISRARADAERGNTTSSLSVSLTPFI